MIDNASMAAFVYTHILPAIEKKSPRSCFKGEIPIMASGTSTRARGQNSEYPLDQNWRPNVFSDSFYSNAFLPDKAANVI